MSDLNLVDIISTVYDIKRELDILYDKVDGNDELTNHINEITDLVDDVQSFFNNPININNWSEY